MMRIRTDIFVLIAMALILNACGRSAVKPSVKTAFSKDTLTIVSDGSDPAFWIFVGSSSEARQDWVRPLDKDTLIINHMGMNNSDYGGGIPCAVVWNKSECIALGSLSPVPLNRWSRDQPSYEEEYNMDAAMTDKSKYGEGYSLPCLFHIGDNGWALVCETGVTSQYCGSHLSDYS